MKLLDCTLRDGANVVGNGFSKELTISIIEGLLNAGIKNIELGNAKGIGAYDQLGSVSPLTDKEYMEIAGKYADKGNLGFFMLAKCAKKENIHMAANYGVNFVRVGNNAGDGEKSLAAIHLIKSQGIICRYSLMKAYISTPKQLANEASMLEKEGVDSITIMDSAGTMTPNQTTDYVRALKEKTSIPIGFHGHNNLGLSQANALAAWEAGAEELDCGLLGMARSAGNCSTEMLIAALQMKNILKDIDLYRLLQYLDTLLIPAMEHYHYRPAVKPLDLILGMTGCHSSFLNLFKNIADQTGVPLYPLITQVSALDRKTPSEALILEVAKKLKNKKAFK